MGEEEAEEEAGEGRPSSRLASANWAQMRANESTAAASREAGARGAEARGALCAEARLGMRKGKRRKKHTERANRKRAAPCWHATTQHQLVEQLLRNRGIRASADAGVEGGDEHATEVRLLKQTAVRQ